MSFRTIITNGDRKTPVATFITSTFEDAARLTNEYLDTLEDVDVSKDYVVDQFKSPCIISNPYRTDFKMNVPQVVIDWKNSRDHTHMVISTFA
jgi:hypothetical protein